MPHGGVSLIFREYLIVLIKSDTQNVARSVKSKNLHRNLSNSVSRQDPLIVISTKRFSKVLYFNTISILLVGKRLFPRSGHSTSVTAFKLKHSFDNIASDTLTLARRYQ